MNNVVRTALAFFLATNLATAAEWYADPYLLYTAQFSDNRRVSTGSSTNTFGNLVTGGATLGTQTETQKFYVEPSVVIRRYDNEDDLLDTDDAFVDLFFENRTERYRFLIAGNYRHESTITSELASADDGNPDLDDPVQDDTGDTRTNVRRDRLNIRPKWTYDLSERTILLLGARYTTVDYDEAMGTTRSDYDSGRIDLGFRYKISEKTQFGPLIKASTFEADRTGNETDNLSIELVISHDYSPQTTVTARAGAVRSKASFIDNGGPVESESTDGIFDLRLTRSTELTDWTASLSRLVSPSGSGFQTTRDQLLLRFDRALSDRTRLIFRSRLYSSESSDDRTTNSDRDYARAEIELDWQVTRRFAVTTTYQYTMQKRDATSQSSDANTISLSFGYRPKRLAVSR